MASSMTEDDLPPGHCNVFVLTPKISEETDTHVNDILKLLKEREDRLGVKLYVHVEIVKTGLQFFWDITEYENF